MTASRAPDPNRPGPGPPQRLTVREVHVLAPHFKRRLSGVTTTMIQLVPVQAPMLRAQAMELAVIGPGLPEGGMTRLRGGLLPGILRRPGDARRRVWHARRNIEMLPGIILRDVLRAPLALLFTSASQREHTRYTRWLISRMDRVVATSERGRSYLRVPADVVMHGIDTERFRPPHNVATLRRELGLMPGRNYVGCFGRIRERKGTGDFVDAMLRLLPDRPDWTALVAGRTTPEHAGFERALRERVVAGGLSDRIRFIGEHRHIERWHGALDLFVAPQRWEGFGMTPLEAMASGVPVVATDVGAFSELLTPETGLIVPPGDVDGMSAACAELMDDDARRRVMGTAARTHVSEHFPLTLEAERLNRIYVELAEPHHR